MPTLETANSWLTQSTLLLQARPNTTRITTKYTLPSKPAPDSDTTPTAIATLTLKTYDPVSGTTLKYNTNKAAEVGRLIQILGRLARPMAGLAEVKEDAVTMVDAGARAEAGSGIATPVVEADKIASQPGKTTAGGGGGAGGKKGKKKGKK